MKICSLLIASLLVCTQSAYAGMTYTVINGSDSGPGSFRAAIMASNAHNPGANNTNTIVFESGYTIGLLSPLPSITNPVTINPANMNPQTVVLDGAGIITFPALPNPLIGLDFEAGSSGSSVNKITIQNFTGVTGTAGVDGQNALGINIAFVIDAVEVENCTITNITGGAGSSFENGTNGGSAYGILNSSDSSTLSSNMIQNITGGIAGTGSTPSSGGSAFGISNTGTNNVISANTIISVSGGVSMSGGNGGLAYGVSNAGTSNNVTGNFISTIKAGGASGNGGSAYGVSNAGTSNSITSNIISTINAASGEPAGSAYGITNTGMGNNVTGNQITGLTGGTANTAAGFGVGIFLSDATQTNVQGNPIKTITGGQSFSSVGADGIGIFLSDTTESIIQNNNITIIAGGTGGENDGNAYGIEVTGVITGSSNNLIGAPDNTAMLGNVIYAFTGTGVAINGTTSVNNAIVSNSIYGVTPDSGIILNMGNDNQVAPSLTSVILCPKSGNILVSGSLSQTASATQYLIQFFDNADDTPGQAKTFIGSITITGNGGMVNFNQIFVPSTMVSTGDYISATATVLPLNGNTSMISNIVGVTTDPDISITVMTAPNCLTAPNPTGTITVNATGGTEPFQYSLNNQPYQNSNTFTGLEAGMYTVNVKDSLGCPSSTTATVAEDDLSVSATTTPACTNVSNGTITANASGGMGTFSYSIDGINYQNSNTFTGLAANTYTVSVKDSNGCVNSTQATVDSDPNAILVTATAISPSFNNNPTGAIKVTATGGSGTYSYSLDNVTFQTSSVFRNLLPGTYTVYVKDNVGCTGTASVVISTYFLPATSFTNSCPRPTCNR